MNGRIALVMGCIFLFGIVFFAVNKEFYDVGEVYYQEQVQKCSNLEVLGYKTEIKPYDGHFRAELFQGENSCYVFTGVEKLMYDDISHSLPIILERRS